MPSSNTDSKRTHSDMSETSDDNLNKKLKTHNDNNLTAKQKKKAARARKLGMSFEIQDGEMVIHPKLFFKPLNDFASMKDVRNLMLTTLSPKGKQARLAEIPDFPGIAPINKAIIIDVPILDPYTMQLPLDVLHVSHTATPDIYKELKSSAFYHYAQQIDDEEREIIAMVSAVGFDQYKRVHDRFLELLEVPLSKAEIKKKREEEDADPDQKRRITPEALVMTTEELRLEEFPIPLALDPESALEEGWVDTLPGTGLEPKRLVALDCEMCKTVNGYAVTRVAMIDRDHKVLINELVKPAEEITDYVTHISGVDEASLKNVTTNLSEIQKKIQTFLDGDTILVGHGLVNDLRCLKMRHPYIIDTSVIYHHKNGPPYKPSLKDLSIRYLKRAIQIEDEDKKPGEEKGHDPCEDAIASLELLERKLRYGHQYGLAGLSQVESILDHLKRNQQTGAVIECGAEMSYLMKQRLAQHKDDYWSLEDDDQVVDKIIEQHKKKQLVVARLSLPEATEDTRQLRFLSLLGKMYDHIEPNTAYCFTTGYRSNREREDLREKRMSYKKKLKATGLANIPDEERWSLEDEHALETIADATRRGFVFASVKNPI
ncbi:hypothetical protein A0J61_10003 [Choanephora cucurbitarum]|uniref:Exonuclease domain-containing protein n=1 Tax=Choanephora cucurbitarum TaxID=101091 RepID=A0A1C7MYV2_9FUNG|nr:hypothetical protein A0J61_10003 [Choanephora cucurbitarum]